MKTHKLIITFETLEYLNYFVEMLEMDSMHEIDNGIVKWQRKYT